MHVNDIATTALWDAATTDHDAAEHRGLVVRATIALAGTWPFLAAATSMEAFEQRLALMQEQIEQRTPPEILGEVVAGLREKFAALQEARLTDQVMARTAARAIAVVEGDTALPQAYVHVHKQGSGDSEYHQVDFIGSPTFLQTLGRSQDRDDAITKAREYALPHGLPLYENGRYVEGKRLRELFAPDEEFFDAKTGSWVPVSKLPSVTAHQSWTAGGTGLHPGAGIADEAARARRDANWGSHLATNYQPDPDMAWRYRYPIPQPNLAQGGQPTAPGSGSIDVAQQANMSSIDPSDGFPLDVAQGEYAGAAAQMQRQLTPQPWTVTPGTEWPVRQNAGHPGEKVYANRRTAGDTATVGSPRECDIHKYVHKQPGVPASYDGKTQSGPWANMCEDCFQQHGVGLGTGKGQRLVQASRRQASDGNKSTDDFYTYNSQAQDDTGRGQWAPCPDCRGTGGEYTRCRACNGHGERRVHSSSRRQATEGAVPTPGANPNYFSQGTQGLAGPAQFSEDPSAGIEPKTDNRVNDVYGDVPPMVSPGSAQGQVDGGGYSRQGVNAAKKAPDVHMTLEPKRLNFDTGPIDGYDVHMHHPDRPEQYRGSGDAGDQHFNVGWWPTKEKAIEQANAYGETYRHGWGLKKPVTVREASASPGFSRSAGERTTATQSFAPGDRVRDQHGNHATVYRVAPAPEYAGMPAAELMGGANRVHVAWDGGKGARDDAPYEPSMFTHAVGGPNYDKAVQQLMGDRPFSDGTPRCPTCFGQGKVNRGDDETECPTCGGTGSRARTASTTGQIVGLCDRCNKPVRYHTEKGGHLQHLHNASPFCLDGKAATAMRVVTGGIEYRFPLPKESAVLENPSADNPTGRGSDPYRAKTTWEGFQQQRPRQQMDGDGGMNANTPTTAPEPIKTGPNQNTPNPGAGEDDDDENGPRERDDSDE